MAQEPHEDDFEKNSTDVGLMGVFAILFVIFVITAVAVYFAPRFQVEEF